MLVDLISGAVLIASLIGLAIVIGRKFPTLAAIDVQATTDPTVAKKTSILEQRLRRKFTGAWDRISSSSQPWLTKAGEAGRRLQKKLVDLEHEYKVRSLPVLLNRRHRHKVDAEVQELLEQARLFMNDGEYKAAEEKGLQAVRLEPRSVPTFQFLGELYLTSKEYQHAKEVYRYLLKLVGDSDAIYEHMAEADRAEGNLAEAKSELSKAVALNATSMNYHLELAQVERQLGEWSEAFANIQAAVRMEPNHPKVLDELIEISLGYGKKQFAEDALNTIRAKNPDNTKIPEWEERIAAL